MTGDIEQLLREGMDRATRGLRVPEGLAREAARRARQRQQATRAVTAAGTATVMAGTAAVVAGVTGAPGHHGGTGQVQTVAYVVSRVERALAPHSSQSRLVSRMQARYSPAFGEAPLPESTVIALGPPGSNSPWQVSTEAGWEYHGLRRQTAFNRAGQPVFDFGLRGTGRAPVTTAVIYRDRTWWRVRGMGPTPPKMPHTGGTAITILGIGNMRHPAPPWRLVILKDLASHRFRIAGHQQVDGVNAVKLVAVGKTAPEPDAIWVNPATFLPVRTLSTLALIGGRHDRAWREQIDFQWFKPTRASLAHLGVPIPAGYTRVPAP